MQEAQRRYQARQAAKAASKNNGAPPAQKTRVCAPQHRRGAYFCQLPEKVTKTLIEQEAGRTAWVMVVLLQWLWYKHPNHYNPVYLTNPAAASVRLSKDQKWRALQELEKIGLVAVFREKRKTPIVELEWQPRRLPL
jgi:hypothetical protein